MTKLWCIHTSSWFSFDHLSFIWLSLVWPFLLHLSLPAYHPFLESHEWDSQWDICFCLWIFFWRFHHRILKTLTLQMFLSFWWWRSSKILNHDKISFIVDEVYTRYASSTWISWAISTPCSYILEDISNHAFCSIYNWSFYISILNSMYIMLLDSRRCF